MPDVKYRMDYLEDGTVVWYDHDGKKIEEPQLDLRRLLRGPRREVDTFRLEVDARTGEETWYDGEGNKLEGPPPLNLRELVRGRKPEAE